MDPELVRNFREILRVFERELDKQNNSSCCCGVTLSQCHALMELSKRDDINLNQLSAKLSIDKSAVSRTIETLVNKELVVRIIPKENRRITNLNLTQAGVNVCHQINTGNDDYYFKALKSISTEDLSIFLRSFNNLATQMVNMNSE